MRRYKVELLSMDRKDESRDVQFFTVVEADDGDDAVDKAKAVQKLERPEINPADTWVWSYYETAER